MVKIENPYLPFPTRIKWKESPAIPEDLEIHQNEEVYLLQI